jgi:hypothetical protein
MGTAGVPPQRQAQGEEKVNDTFWGLVVLAVAIATAAILLSRGLARIAHELEARNAMLSLLGKRQVAARIPAVSDKR